MDHITDHNNVIPIKVDAQALKTRLLAHFPDVLGYLLPNGIIERGKFLVGDIHNNQGRSLSVTLQGNKAGLWHDFATGAGGDIFDLWALVKGIDRNSQFKKLLQEINAIFGDGGFPQYQSKTSLSHNKRTLGTPTAKWDYTDEHGSLIATVYRYDPQNGKKQFRPWDAIKGCMKAPDVRPLYNQVGLKTTETVLLVEGEKCAEALISVGIAATTAMNGSNAPIEKTDWSPLRDKKVIIWPDHDDAGIEYAKRAASAIARAGAIAVKILKVPDDKPSKWDSADAVAEGLNIRSLLKQWGRIIAKDEPEPSSLIPTYSIVDINNDRSPMPDDLIAPRVLTPGGTLVLGGAPKVGKSDFLIHLLAHAASGKEFLGLTPMRSQRIFYLQAEVQYHYLRERIQRLNLNIPASHFVMTPQISIIMNDTGLDRIIETIRHAYPDDPPDIIVIDPIRNVFDGGGIGGENDNDAMMFFLTQRIEKLRMTINPNAGIILAHHTRKINKKALEEDPFQALSGAGSLRSYYTSGMLLFKPDEAKDNKSLMFELRNGPAIPTKILQRQSNQWKEMNETSERLVMKQHGHKLDAERLRKKHVILQLIYDEAKKSSVYTARQFSEAFENKAGLGGARSIRDRLNILMTKGFVKFFKDAERYNLPLSQRSRQGYLCVEDMALENGEVILPTHFKHPQSGDIMPVDDPTSWIRAISEEDL